MPGGTLSAPPSNSAGVGDYAGVVRVPRRVFQILLPEAPIPERCLKAYHLSELGLNASPSGGFTVASLWTTAMSRSSACDLCERKPEERHIPPSTEPGAILSR
jgi:hypothetical protein